MSGRLRSRPEDGASAVEYGLIAFAIAALITIVVFSLGIMTNQMFTDSCTDIKAGYDSAGVSAGSC